MGRDKCWVPISFLRATQVNFHSWNFVGPRHGPGSSTPAEDMNDAALVAVDLVGGERPWRISNCSPPNMDFVSCPNCRQSHEWRHEGSRDMGARLN